MRKIEYLEEYMKQGRAAYEGSARTAEEAKKLNPHKGFGAGDEHQRFISWNRGWNMAKKEAEEGTA